jgi:hypothetical protein
MSGNQNKQPAPAQPSLYQQTLGNTVETFGPGIAKSMAPTFVKKGAPSLDRNMAAKAYSTTRTPTNVSSTPGNRAPQPPAEARQEARQARRPGPFSATGFRKPSRTGAAPDDQMDEDVAEPFIPQE